MKKSSFNSKDIFTTDPNNPNSTLLKIPEEILKAQGWTEGTLLKVRLGDQGTIIVEEVEKEVDKSQ